MSTNLGKNEAPAASRARAAGWRDPRLWIGVALVAASVLIGVKVLGGADKTIEVWAAGTDLASGQEINEDQLVARRIGFAEEDDRERYLEVGEALPDDKTLTRAVGTGELLPAAAMGESDGTLEEVPFSLPSTGVPPDLEPGWRVKVIVTSPAGSDGTTPTGKVILEDVVVVAAPKPEESFGAAADRQIVVGVEEGNDKAVALLVAASKERRVGITAVGAQ